MAIFQVVEQDGQKALVEVSSGGGSREVWGVYVPGIVPEDVSELIAGLPAGAFVVDDATGGGSAPSGIVVAIPKGGIISFSGEFGGEDNRFPIPLGETEPDLSWVLCDGIETNGLVVPNLADRFIIGASATRGIGSVGGELSHTHDFSGTVQGSTLSVAQLASHTHTTVQATGTYDQHSTGGYDDARTTLIGRSTGGNYTGSNQAHAHGLSGSIADTSILPPYYALAYIMKIA